MKKFLLVYLLLTIVISAQQTGNLSGNVTDAATGESLPGVNIILKGTYFGAASDINGNFNRSGIPVGTYNVDISLIGYKTYQYTGTKIESNKTTRLDVKLEETVLTLEQDVVVIGEKPLMDVEETQSKRSISKEEIDQLIVENIQNIVSQQSGVVVNNSNEVHIDFDLKSRRSSVWVVGIAAALAVVLAEPRHALAALASVYLVSGPIGWIVSMTGRSGGQGGPPASGKKLRDAFGKP